MNPEMESTAFKLFIKCSKTEGCPMARSATYSANAIKTMVKLIFLNYRPKYI